MWVCLKQCFPVISFIFPFALLRDTTVDATWMSLSRMNCGAFALVLFSLLHLETKSHCSEVVLDGQGFSFVCLNLSNKMQINLYKSNGNIFLKNIYFYCLLQNSDWEDTSTIWRILHFNLNFFAIQRYKKLKGKPLCPCSMSDKAFKCLGK